MKEIYICIVFCIEISIKVDFRYKLLLILLFVIGKKFFVEFNFKVYLFRRFGEEEIDGV